MCIKARVGREGDSVTYRRAREDSVVEEEAWRRRTTTREPVKPSMSAMLSDNCQSETTTEEGMYELDNTTDMYNKAGNTIGQSR